MIADLKPYPAIKDSGLEWLGHVPEHWEVRTIKTLYREKDQRSGDGQGLLLSFTRTRGILPHSDVSSRMSSASDLSQYRVCMPGDLVMNRMQAWSGMLSVSSIGGLVSPDYSVFVPTNPSETCAAFFEYLFRTPRLIDQFARRSKGIGSGFNRLYTPDFGTIRVTVPPTREQIAIVHYLEHTERRIRRYIRAKQKLIALLEEQKQAVIHHAVTRGANPEVTLKPTESSWFPLVPSHWNVMPMRRVVMKTVDGPHHSPDYLDQGIPFLSARNIKVDRWSFEDVKFISQSDYDIFCQRVKPEVGDVLYTKGGTTGVARFVDLDYPFQVWVHVAVLKLRRDLALPHWLAATLNSPRCYEQSQLFTRGATNQDLGLGRMKGIVFPVPPLSDQKAIAKQVIEIDDRIGRGIQAASREIELVTEYRTRLIADVVTGKLDVRKAVARLPDETETSQAMDRPDAPPALDKDLIASLDSVTQSDEP